MSRTTRLRIEGTVMVVLGVLMALRIVADLLA